MASILLVDDDGQFRLMLSTVLRRMGYQVQEACDGKQAVEFYQRCPTDLVITDLLMPEKDGLELIREFRRDYPAARIIAISGGGRQGRANCLKVAQALGAQRVLDKPFSQREILELVRGALEA